MRYLSLFLILVFISCKKEIKETVSTNEQQQSTVLATTVSYPLIGVQSTNPDLYPAVEESGWDDGTIGFYTRSLYVRTFTADDWQSVQYGFEKGSVHTAVLYPCYIANKNPMIKSGANDFVLPLSSGIPHTINYPDGTIGTFYSFPGMLNIYVYQNGDLIFPNGSSGGYKAVFNVEDMVYKLPYDWTQERIYGGDTTAICGGAADEYYNPSEIPVINGVPAYGDYATAVELNPYKLIHEASFDGSDPYANNIASFGFTFTSIGATWNKSVVSDNITPKQAANISATVVDNRGKYKTVQVTWFSHSVESCIGRTIDNGIETMVNTSEYYNDYSGNQVFIDNTVPKNAKTVSYVIQSENVGATKVTRSNRFTLNLR